MNDRSYTLCAVESCPFFVERNYGFEEDSNLAEFVHLTRGDEADEERDDHNAIPGETQTLDWWKTNGPVRVTERFV